MKTSPEPPSTFPPPSGAWARSAGTLAQVWVDRSVQPDCTKKDLAARAALEGPDLLLSQPAFTNARKEQKKYHPGRPPKSTMCSEKPAQ